MASGLGPSSQAPSRLESDYIRLVGESVGAPVPTFAAQAYLADQVTTLLQRIIYDAAKYTAHGRRCKMVAGDIDASMLKHRLKKDIPLGFVKQDVAPLQRIGNGMTEDVYVPMDSELELAEMRAAADAKVPIQPYLRAHWLVFNGQVPRVPENMTHEPEVIVDSDDRKRSTAAAAIANRRETAGASSRAAGHTFQIAARQVKRREKVMIQPPSVETLSVEQQAYFKEVVEACLGVDDKRRHEALASLEIDTGVQALLPRISRLIFDSVRFNVVTRCLSMLIYLNRMIDAIQKNPSVRLEPVLHEIVPSLLSCILGRTLCLRPESDNHWALRDYSAKALKSVLAPTPARVDQWILRTRAARILKNILATRRDTDLFRRVVKVLFKTYDDQQSTYGQIYGALNMLSALTTDQERYEMYNRFVDLMNITHPSAINSLPPDMKAEAGKLNGIIIKMENQVFRSYRIISEQM